MKSLLESGDRLRYVSELIDSERRKDRNKLRKLRQQPLPPRRSITPSEAAFLGIEPDDAARRRGQASIEAGGLTPLASSYSMRQCL